MQLQHTGLKRPWGGGLAVQHRARPFVRLCRTNRPSLVLAQLVRGGKGVPSWQLQPASSS